MAHPRFCLAEVSEERILLRDLGPWDIHPTITNGAENVVERVQYLLKEYPRARLDYIDSEGEEATLVVKDGKFVGFASVPLPTERQREGGAK